MSRKSPNSFDRLNQLLRPSVTTQIYKNIEAGAEFTPWNELHSTVSDVTDENMDYMVLDTLVDETEWNV